MNGLEKEKCLALPVTEPRFLGRPVSSQEVRIKFYYY
jgi:hypothetical protein